MKLLSPFVAFFTLSLCSCVSHNHRFTERGDGAPDIAALEEARQALPDDDRTHALGDAGWYPLVRLYGRIYGPTDGVGFPEGTTYSEVDSWGPLFCLADAEICRYDDALQLYERERESSWLWGFYRTTRSDVLTPHGWRVHGDTRLLFGLLRWPSDGYSQRAPFEASHPPVAPRERPATLPVASAAQLPIPRT